MPGQSKIDNPTTRTNWSACLPVARLWSPINVSAVSDRNHKHDETIIMNLVNDPHDA
jgi:hypothetical protein